MPADHPKDARRERWIVVLDCGDDDVRLSGVADSRGQAEDQLRAVAAAVFGDRRGEGSLRGDVFAVPGSKVRVRINHSWY